MHIIPQLQSSRSLLWFVGNLTLSISLVLSRKMKHQSRGGVSQQMVLQAAILQATEDRLGQAAISLLCVKLLGSEPWQRLCSQPFSQGSDVRRPAAHYTMEPAAGKSTFHVAKGILAANNLDKQCILESIVCTPTFTSQYHFPTAVHLWVCRVRAVAFSWLEAPVCSPSLVLFCSRTSNCFSDSREPSPVHSIRIDHWYPLHPSTQLYVSYGRLFFSQLPSQRTQTLPAGQVSAAVQVNFGYLGCNNINNNAFYPHRTRHQKQQILTG